MGNQSYELASRGFSQHELYEEVSGSIELGLPREQLLAVSRHDRVTNPLDERFNAAPGHIGRVKQPANNAPETRE
jgi:hypothetical protein